MDGQEESRSAGASSLSRLAVFTVGGCPGQHVTCMITSSVCASGSPRPPQAFFSASLVRLFLLSPTSTFELQPPSCTITNPPRERSTPTADTRTSSRAKNNEVQTVCSALLNQLDRGNGALHLLFDAYVSIKHTPAVTREARLSEVTLQQTTVAKPTRCTGLPFCY